MHAAAGGLVGGRGTLQPQVGQHSRDPGLGPLLVKQFSLGMHVVVVGLVLAFLSRIANLPWHERAVGGDASESDGKVAFVVSARCT